MAKKKKTKKVTKHGAVHKLKYCPQCKKSHYKSVHLMHGKGSYKKSRSAGNIKRAKAKARRK
jgi:hypothetical protein|tara:strand:- start:715 stop:900 length:186 start_codon:yes stop_codon:yes gene_type:complete